jgi:hypothetical protein
MDDGLGAGQVTLFRRAVCGTVSVSHFVDIRRNNHSPIPLKVGPRCSSGQHLGNLEDAGAIEVQGPRRAPSSPQSYGFVESIGQGWKLAAEDGLNSRRRFYGIVMHTG